MTVVEAFAPAKINLTLHVTGRRADGYHLLDSLVVFADVGDRVSVRLAGVSRLRVTGPMAAGVPVGPDNLVLRAVALTGTTAEISLEKHLPAAAGIGGGSSDAAATLRALARMRGQPVPEGVLTLGADVPVCMLARAARMCGIGEEVSAVAGLPLLHAVLINPRVPVPTPAVFRRLTCRDNPPMPDELPAWAGAGDLVRWLAEQRNDLQDPAIAEQPVIAQVIERLGVTPGCQLARMSGSGATCFGLYDDAETASSAASRLAAEFPGWWIRSARLS